MAELVHNARTPADSLAIPALASKADRLTALQWLICGVAALGFAFDLYEMVVLSVVVRPALVYGRRSSAWNSRI